MGERVLEFTGLEIGFATAQGVTEAVKGISFGVRPGEVVAVVGESGSGKSATSLSALGLLPSTATVDGSVVLAGDDLLKLSEKDLRARRGDDIAMVFQEPMTALNPLRTIGWQVAEALLLHRELSTADARARAEELLALVGIDEPGRRLDQYPHELSGGLRQRVMIAMALSCEPKVLIADEPTTALDVTVQAEILDLLRRMRDELGTAIVLITHSMGVVADLADRVVVLYRGEIVEEGDVRRVFAEPSHDYTRRLLAAVPHLGRAPARVVEAKRADEPPALVVRDLVVDFAGRRGAGKFRAVDEVSFEIAPREVLGLVGESGSGKTTVGRCAVRLQKPSSGRIEVFGTDVAGLPPRRLREVRKRIGMVFQDPASSLDPRMTVGECVAEPLVLGKSGSRAAREARVAELLDSVRLEKAHRDRYPHELSGGQRQRVSLARALAMDPALLVADEPTSALDVSVQAAVLDLLGQLQRELGFACLFISHDLAVIDQLADRVVVMRKGKVVEQGTRDEVLRTPKEDYTRRLLASAPVPDPVEQRARRESR
ncbi:ABC transporter ATP-binding protein [Amycolatopsis minnesotensis]|uniref:ABC transporter ATP-binding protein n=1 Tax=Amycolatopsis minnesotensis TaxID=337894 RepID=A0ABN2QPC3_9PSEU